MTLLAERAARLALAYITSAIASTVAVMLVYAVSSRILPIGLEVLLVGAFVFELSAPVAWLPLFLFLCAALGLRCRPLAACLVAGAATGAALEIWAYVQLDPVFNHRGGSHETLSWPYLAEQFADGLPIVVPGGLVGGLVFWAVYFRRASPPRAPATPA